MKKNKISTVNAPGAIGPYSQAIEAGSFIFVSGQIPLNPSTGQIDGITAANQAERCLNNVKAILQEADLSMDSVVKTTIFLKDMNSFTQVNEVYAKFFTEPYPARATVEVARLPKDVLVEIEVIASRK